jgi:hypothetical protein
MATAASINQPVKNFMECHAVKCSKKVGVSGVYCTRREGVTKGGLRRVSFCFAEGRGKDLHWQGPR